MIFRKCFCPKRNYFVTDPVAYPPAYPPNPGPSPVPRPAAFDLPASLCDAFTAPPRPPTSPRFFFPNMKHDVARGEAVVGRKARHGGAEEGMKRGDGGVVRVGTMILLDSRFPTRLRSTRAPASLRFHPPPPHPRMTDSLSMESLAMPPTLGTSGGSEKYMVEKLALASRAILLS